MWVLFEAGLIINFGLNLNQVSAGAGMNGYVARIEPTIPFALGILATLMLPFMFVVDDSDLVAAREKVKEHGMLASFKVKVDKTSVVQGVETAEDLLAHVFYRSAESQRELRSGTKWRWLLSVLASSVISIAPFIVCIYYDYPFFGNCKAEDMCSDRNNGILVRCPYPSL